MGRMPEASLPNTKFRLNTVLSKTLFFKKHNPYVQSQVSIVLINHKVKS